ncbi:chemotaxis protein CheW [Jannaschia ovalis]|uniref:Chemotaxis protein CheW n=1 Tax=Jannaschia ovalis TaxID=3038773 RepID=A0ABY8LFR1_9RHOB|nr:chemotaxis protein CheW [Jannaschia sp. GRR-S6-38]WGH80141.1 chemotaxis protein CheW [Jannaschia sp. GRR-S6-38]
MTAEPDQAAFTHREMITFDIDAQSYCMDIMRVREIRGWTEVTVLPHAPDYVLGIINLRGSVVPIVDLSARLGLAPLEPGPRHVILVTQLGPRMVGFLVTAVSDIFDVDAAGIQPIPRVWGNTQPSFLEGVIAGEERSLGVLDVAAAAPEIGLPDDGAAL